MFQTPPRQFGAENTTATIKASNSEKSAKKSLCFDSPNKDLPIVMEKNTDRKRQNDQVVESLIPAKRFKSDENKY